MEETGRGREEPMKAFISNFELMDKHVTEEQWPSRTHTHTHSQETMISFPGLCTHSKTKTAGLKMGPCHSLLEVNLLCPQSCFFLSHSTPFTMFSLLPGFGPLSTSQY